MRTTLLVLVAVAPACALDEPEPGVPAVSKVVICDDINCPGNSNILGGLGVYELSMKQDQVSPRGFTFDRNNVTQPGLGGAPIKLTQFQVVGASLRAVKQGLPIKDAALMRAVLSVHHINGHDYRLEIVDYLPGQYYDGNSNLPVISGYYIRYQDVSIAGADWHDLCPYKDYDDPRPGVAGTYAVFWKGDRYDPATGQILAIDD